MAVDKIYSDGSTTSREKISSHDKLSNYILVKLGKGAINVELTQEQIDMCIFDAIGFFLERHGNGVEEVGMVYSISAGDKSNGYITLPDEVEGIHKILDSSSAVTGDEFDRLNFLIANSDLLRNSFNIGNLQNYFMARRNLAEIKYFFQPFRDYEFNKLTHRLWFRTDMTEVSQIALLGYRSLNPVVDLDLYNDIWLRKYATALARIQWADNLLKYTGLSMPGGGEINAAAILDRGEKDKEDALIEFRETYESMILPQVH